MAAARSSPWETPSSAPGRPKFLHRDARYQRLLPRHDLHRELDGFRRRRADPIGTYAYDDEVLTLDYDEGESYDYFYEFKQGGETMVLTLAEGLSLSLTYRRVEKD